MPGATLTAGRTYIEEGLYAQRLTTANAPARAKASSARLSGSGTITASAVIKLAGTEPAQAVSGPNTFAAPISRRAAIEVFYSTPSELMSVSTVGPVDNANP